jgi:hypothetical protein
MNFEPICPMCNVRARSFDSEPPGPGGYFSNCSTCTTRIAVAPWCGCGDALNRAEGTLRYPNEKMRPVVVNDAVVSYECSRCGAKEEAR